MKYLISIHEGGPSAEAPFSALEFAKSVVKAGHQLQRVFFYGDAVQVASSFIRFPSDEVSMHGKWKKFAIINNLDIFVCVSAALRNGVLTQQEAYANKSQWNMEPPFVLAGLGSFVEDMVHADRCVVFGR